MRYLLKQYYSEFCSHNNNEMTQLTVTFHPKELEALPDSRELTPVRLL